MLVFSYHSAVGVFDSSNPTLEASPNVVALPGSDVTLSCNGTLQLTSTGQCEHRGCAEIKWVHARGLMIINLSANNNTEELTDAVLSLGSKIVLNSISPSDGGVYTCRIDLMGSSVMALATAVTVPGMYQCTHHKLYSVFSLSTVLQITGNTNQLTVGSTLMLTCSLNPSVAGNSFQWTTTGGAIISNSSVLQLTVTPELNGTEYTCTASSDNLMGTPSRSVIVTVRG